MSNDRFIIKTGLYKGEYELDDSEFTTLEWSWIKKFSGYLPLTAEEGFKGADPELYVALAVVAMHRAGRVEKGEAKVVYDRLADLPFGEGLTFKPGEDEPEEGEEDPPDAPSATG